jgi:hypothetical protein
MCPTNQKEHPLLKKNKQIKTNQAKNESVSFIMYYCRSKGSHSESQSNLLNNIIKKKLVERANLGHGSL